MIDKILIANRGEIALRIIRTCKEMGIHTIAIYSEADRDSAHIAFADEAICIGPAQAIKSYLDIFTILDAAIISNVDAIHPGYGFLSETPQFAEICNQCAITFIGPTPETLNLLRNKIKTREIVKKEGVPVISSSNCNIRELKDATKIAHNLGYPVIIKTSTGWGSRGMKIIYNDEDLKDAFFTALTVAHAAVYNPCVYIEKFIEDARHIEFQIIADKNGNTIHLGERDCTVRRKYQKLIEESPSPFLNNKLRKEIGDIAIKAAKTVGYTNAGSVKFLLDKNKNYYFKEINARIQVEHPVTEVLTYIDIIKEQIKIAAGEELTYKQKNIKFNGHALECRIIAEDPAHDFLPSVGTINELFIPGGMGIRIDTHIYKGYKLPQYYDSIIAKLIVFAKNRKEVIDKSLSCLDEFRISGIHTTVTFLKKILSDAVFRKGKYTSDIVKKINCQK